MKALSALTITVIATGFFPLGTAYVFRKAREPGGALGGLSSSELHTQMESLRERAGVTEGSWTVVSHGPEPNGACTFAKSHFESSVARDWN